MRVYTQSLHVDYIVAAANLMAFVFGLKLTTRVRAELATVAAKISVAEFVPKTGVKFARTEDEYNQNCNNVIIGTPLIHTLSNL